MSDADCTQPDGHRYDADGRCQWCDAEAENNGWETRTAADALVDAVDDNQKLRAEITRLRARVRELEACDAERNRPGDWRRMAL